MGLPAEVKNAAISQVTTYCATKVPAEHDDKIRIEYKLRGNTLTIYECRPPWREDFGPEWTSRRVCVFEWDRAARGWRLYAMDRNNRRLDYPFVETTPDLLPLLREIETDPTCIFWG